VAAGGYTRRGNETRQTAAIASRRRRGNRGPTTADARGPGRGLAGWQRGA